MGMQDTRKNGNYGSHHGEQAERWLARLQAPDCGTDERVEFERWQAERPEHARAYAHAERLYQRSALLRADPALQAATRNARIRTAHARERNRSLRWGLSLAAAASLVLVAGLVGWRNWNPVQSLGRYATEVGERRSIELHDGSTVLLDTNSAITVEYRRKQRDVTLQRGQAQFSVASQPDRPFIVHAGSGSVRAVGTEFQVRRIRDTVQVTLLEGIVAVNASPAPDGQARHTRLQPGDQLRFDARGLWARSDADLEVAQGWTRGELVFRRRPLRELIAEMNRHTRTKLRLGDPALGDLPVSGVFYDNDQSSLILALEHGWSLRAARASPDEIVLHRR